MILVDTQLKKREESGNILKVGVIGAGEMAKGMINQLVKYTPGMTVACVFGRNPEKSERSIRCTWYRSISPYQSIGGS